MEIPIPLPGRYRVRRVLGSGGMATVYLADDAETGREVAVKVMKPDLVSAQAVERFLREIRMTHDLEHPHIVPVLQAGEARGVPFFVMPRIPGLTLRQRLQRERQLPVPEVVRVTTALAAALAFAHERNVIHRDVKPENVLLDGERVYLTDFGIARAVSEAAEDRLTESGLAIGTAGYMSPEQASGERTVDARSDIYALACVTYEMLAGEPPFSGATPRDVIAKQLSLDPPAVRILRPRLPDVVDDVLRQALAKSPADRFASVREFGAAFEAAAAARRTLAQRVRRVARRRSTLGVVGAMAVAGLALLARVGVIGPGRSLPDLDPSDSVRVAVFPLALTGGSAEALLASEHAAHVVRTALMQWTDLTVVDDGLVSEALDAIRVAVPSPREAARAARVLRAGRYVRGEGRPVSDGTEIRLWLVNGISTDDIVAEGAVMVPTGATTPDSLIHQLVERLLLGPAAIVEGGGRTRSLAARRAHAAGSRALRQFALATADSAFTRAVQADPQHAAAHLGIALSRLWRDEEPARWAIAVSQASLGAAALTPRDQRILEAVAAFARADLATACAAWGALVRDDVRDAMSHMGRAHCLVSDDIVIRHAASPSGWRFRTSYREALAHYQLAFQLEPAILAAFGGEAMESLRRLFHTGASQLRNGQASAPSPLKFMANMSWSGDTLAFVPYAKLAATPHLVRDPEALFDAIRRQRELVRGIASSWVAAFPHSANAHHSLAVALASLGDPSALDTLARARALATDAVDRLRVTYAALSVQLAFALRDGDSRQLVAVRRLADSLFAHAPADLPQSALIRASIAALTGRAGEAIRLAAHPAVGDAMAMPAVLRDGGAALLVASALGGPADTLAVLEDRVAAQIVRAIPRIEQDRRRAEILARAASMAFPDVRSARLDAWSELDELVLLQHAFTQRDSARVRAGLRAMRAARRDGAAETLSLDAIVPEAALLLALGDAEAAVSWLKPTFDVLPQVEPSPMRSPLHAGSLARGVLLLARAAEQRGDLPTAERYTSAIAILWSDADPFLRARLPERPRGN